MKLLNHPIAKTAAVVIGVLRVPPLVRPYLGEVIRFSKAVAGNLQTRTNHALVQPFTMDSPAQTSSITRTGKWTVTGKTGQGVPPISATANSRNVATGKPTCACVNSEDPFTPQDGRGESESDGDGAIACRDGDDAGLDCRTVANGLPPHAGRLLERATHSPTAGIDTFLILLCPLFFSIVFCGCNHYTPDTHNLFLIAPETEDFSKSGASFSGLWGDMDRDALVGKFQPVDILNWENTISNLTVSGWVTLDQKSSIQDRTIILQKVRPSPDGRNRNDIRLLKLIWKNKVVYVAAIHRGTPESVTRLEDGEYGRWINKVLWQKLDSAVIGKDISP